MVEKPDADHDSDDTHDSDNGRGSLGYLQGVCVAAFWVFIALLLAAIFWPNLSERTKFFTGNFFNLLIAFAVIAQVLIYRKQWQVMKQSTDIAERALVAGQRAYVSVTFKAVAHMDGETSKITDYAFTPIWQNDGNTPTRDMRNHVSIRLFEGPIPRNWDVRDIWSDGVSPDEGNRVALGIAPGRFLEGQSIAVSLDEMVKIVSETKTALLWGWAEYDDVFPKTKKHVTRFAVQIAAAGNPHDHQQLNFTYIFLPNYNCSDEECERQGYPAGWRGAN
jgi:hypothetical protein